MLAFRRNTNLARHGVPSFVNRQSKSPNKRGHQSVMRSVVLLACAVAAVDGFLAHPPLQPRGNYALQAARSSAGSSPSIRSLFGGVSRQSRPLSVSSLRAAADGPAAPTEFKLDSPVAELIGDCKSLGLVRFVTVSLPGIFSSCPSESVHWHTGRETEG